MFNPTTDKLWLEIRAALEETAQHVNSAMDIYRRMTGRWYRKDMNDIEVDPENVAYAFVSNMLPQLAAGNPRVTTKAARVVGHRTVAQAIEDGINAWVEDVDYADRLIPILLDFMVCRGIQLHYLEPDTRFSRGIVTPAAKRISPARFFIDALADEASADDFRGHWFYADLDDLMADPRLVPEAAERLSADESLANVGSGEAGTSGGGGGSGGTSGGGSTSDRLPFARKSGGELGRERVKVYMVWVRERNELRWLAECAGPIELFEPRPFYGSPDGPYRLYDAYPVADQAWPLSPLVAVQAQIHDLNAHARSMARSAANRKKIGLVETAAGDLGDKIVKAQDGEVVPVKGITGQFLEIELAGATAEQYQHTEYLRARVERMIGLTAAVQGNVGQDKTATAEQIGQQNYENRAGFLRRQALRATEGSLYTVGWWMFHTEGIIIPVNRRDPYTGQLQEGLFFGGPSPSDNGATWDDFSLKVEVATVQRIMEQRQNTLGFYQAFLQIAQLAPQMPWVRWMSVLRDLAITFDCPDKPDEWMIPEVFGAFSQPALTPPSYLLGSSPQAQQPRRGFIHPAAGGPFAPGNAPSPGMPGMPGMGAMGGQGGPMAQLPRTGGSTSGGGGATSGGGRRFAGYGGAA